MKKLFCIPFAVIIIYYLFAITTFASTDISADFETFISSANGQTPPEGWIIQNGTADKAGVYSEKTERGTSVMLKTDNIASYLQIRRNFTPTCDGIFSMRLSIYMNDNNVQRIIGIREGTKTIVSAVIFEKNNKITAFGSTVSGAVWQTNKWYDVHLVYDMIAQKYNLFINDDKGNICNAINTVSSGITTLDSMYVTHQNSPADMVAVTYVDDVEVKNNVSSLLIPTAYKYDFDTFVAASNGQTAPSGLLISNGEAGKNGVYSENGALKIHTDSTKSIEVRKLFKEAEYASDGKLLIKAKIKMDDLNVKRRALGLRAVTQSANWTYLVSFNSSEQTITTSSGAVIGNFSLNEWYDIDVEIDLDNCSYTLTVSGIDSKFTGDGALVASFIPYTQISFLFEMSGKGNSYSFIDDFSIVRVEPLTMLTSIPANGRSNVPLSSPVKMIFNGSVDFLRFENLKINDITLQEGNVSFLDEHTLALVYPFEPNTDYTLVAEYRQSLSGELISQRISFRTGNVMYTTLLGYQRISLNPVK